MWQSQQALRDVRRVWITSLGKRGCRVWEMDSQCAVGRVRSRPPDGERAAGTSAAAPRRSGRTRHVRARSAGVPYPYRLQRRRGHDLAGRGCGAQGAGLGGDRQGFELATVGDDGVLIRRLVEDPGWYKALGPDQPNFVDLA